MTLEDLKTIIESVEEKINADGCKGCAFEENDEWQMPCAKCRRAMKDYWRTKK